MSVDKWYIRTQVCSNGRSSRGGSLLRRSMLLILKFELTHVLRSVIPRVISSLVAIDTSRPILMRLNLRLLLLGRRNLLSRRPPRARNSANPLPPQPAIFRAKRHARNPILLPLDILPVERARRELAISILPLHDALPRRVRNAQLAKTIVQIPAVFLWNIPALDKRL